MAQKKRGLSGIINDINALPEDNSPVPNVTDVVLAALSGFIAWNFAGINPILAIMAGVVVLSLCFALRKKAVPYFCSGILFIFALAYRASVSVIEPDMTQAILFSLEGLGVGIVCLVVIVLATSRIKEGLFSPTIVDMQFMLVLSLLAGPIVVVDVVAMMVLFVITTHISQAINSKKQPPSFLVSFAIVTVAHFVILGF